MVKCIRTPFVSLLVAALAAALLSETPVHAQDKTVEIDTVFGWATPTAPGCVVAVSQHGKVVFSRAYGSADLERGVPLGPNAVFDAGSLRKQFVAASVLLLAEEGKLALTDDVRKYFPEMPDYCHKVTLNHLLTHTSGIRDWTGILPLAGGTADVLPLILRQRGLNFAPGDEWSYSNSGFVLLKEIVARTSGMSFADFTQKRLFGPLGMTATTYREDLRDVVKNRALAYEKEGSDWKLAMLAGNERGGGGALLTTAGDLLVWNEALTGGRLGAFVTEKLQEPARLNNGRKLRYARGLTLDSYRGRTLIWHSGGAAGYHSWLGRFPEQGLSIAVLCNSDAVSTSSLARRVADQFLPAAEAETPKGAGPGAAGAELTGRAGLFFPEDTGDPLRLVASGGRLQIVGGGALVTIKGDRFRKERGDLYLLSQDEFELRFLSPDVFELKSMEGKTTRYRRAKPYLPTPADLKALAGRYESDEVGSVFQIMPGKEGTGGLILRFELSPEKSLEMTPVERDTFQRGQMLVRFRRDKAGKIVGFDYSNPLVRRLPFTRLGDRPRP